MIDRLSPLRRVLSASALLLLERTQDAVAACHYPSSETIVVCLSLVIQRLGPFLAARDPSLILWGFAPRLSQQCTIGCALLLRLAAQSNLPAALVFVVSHRFQLDESRRCRNTRCTPRRLFEFLVLVQERSTEANTFPSSCNFLPRFPKDLEAEWSQSLLLLLLLLVTSELNESFFPHYQFHYSKSPLMHLKVFRAAHQTASRKKESPEGRGKLLLLTSF